MAVSIGIHGSNASASTAAIATPSSATTSGSTLVVAANWGSVNFSSIVDSASNSWTQIGSEISASSHKSRAYYAKNITNSGTHTVTVNLSGADAATIFIAEILSADTTNPLDQNGARDDTGASPYDLAAGLTTTFADEALISFFFGNSGSNPATHGESGLGSSTIQDEVTNGTTFWTGACATAIKASTGTFNPSWTETGASSGHVYLVTIKGITPVSGVPLFYYKA